MSYAPAHLLPVSRDNKDVLYHHHNLPPKDIKHTLRTNQGSLAATCARYAPCLYQIYSNRVGSAPNKGRFIQGQLHLVFKFFRFPKVGNRDGELKIEKKMPRYFMVYHLHTSGELWSQVVKLRSSLYRFPFIAKRKNRTKNDLAYNVPNSAKTKHDPHERKSCRHIFSYARHAVPQTSTGEDLGNIGPMFEVSLARVSTLVDLVVRQHNFCQIRSMETSS